MFNVSSNREQAKLKKLKNDLRCLFVKGKARVLAKWLVRAIKYGGWRAKNKQLSKRLKHNIDLCE